ncbi:MAG: hypothetical protein BRD55_06935 [Bacteroidetes bacterium SW_9_63_38]|nr:MAG: hypothetical protein BRD55_06935 [Bacteroidetes bacterium SW_9_63_38]
MRNDLNYALCAPYRSVGKYANPFPKGLEILDAGNLRFPRPCTAASRNQSLKTHSRTGTRRITLRGRVLPLNIPDENQSHSDVRLLLRGAILVFTSCVLVEALIGETGAVAQTLKYRGEIATTVASTAGQPFWLRANEHGRIDAESANGYARIGATGRTDTSRVWEARAGLDLLGRWSASETAHFSELFAQLRYRFAQLRVGRRHSPIGPVKGGGLSTGSLIQSRNATPLPIVSLGTAGYIGVPHTNGFAEVKGHYAHGWFSNDRFVDNVYLHRKAAYLRLGKGRVVSATMGLVHNAQWGGMSPRSGKLPQEMEAYWNAVFAVSASEEDAPEGEQTNVLGNHVGIFDLGSTVRLGDAKVSAYHQHLFEDGSSYEWKNFPDGLYGLRWTGFQSPSIGAIQYEFLHTKDQSGPVHPPGEDNYYNNFVYRSGWSSSGTLLGSPLFLLDPSQAEEEAVISNRIVSHHLGVRGVVSSALRYRLLGTWRRHFGTFDNPFPEPRTRMSFLLELTAVPFRTSAVEVSGAVAVDTGEAMNDRVGLRLGVTYSGQR